MQWQLYVKALYAGVLAFLGPIAGALLADDALGFGDLGAGVWLSAAILGLVAFGGILGWQKAPASVSTSIS